MQSNPYDHNWKVRDMKIILVAPASISPYLNHGDYGEMDVRFYDKGFFMRQARQIISHFPDYKVECWRCDTAVKKTFVWKEKNGLIHRVFPSRKFFHWEVSPQLLMALHKSTKSRNVIVEIHTVYSIMTQIIALTIGSHTPVIVQNHGEGPPAIVNFHSSRHKLLRYFYWLEHHIQRLGLSRIKQIFAINTKSKKEIEILFPGARVSFRPFGIDFNHFSPGEREAARDTCGLPKERQIILFVGRLDPIKNLGCLLKAFTQVGERFPKSMLIIIGGGSERMSLERLAHQLGIHDRVFFTGIIEHQNLPNWYRAADVYVQPSVSEAFSSSCVEAMACGTPLVGSDVGGMPDIVREFEYGLLVPPNDANALANAICQVLNQPDAFKPNIERARQRLDWSVVIKERASLYLRFLM